MVERQKTISSRSGRTDGASLMIPRNILKDIEGYSRPKVQRKYTEEMIEVMEACHKKKMRWCDIAVIMEKHYPNMGLKYNSGTLMRAMNMWRKDDTASKQSR